MQFITNGPDIPQRLLDAHEEGQVVFFCGAGISIPAGLPSFVNLVDEVLRELGEPNHIKPPDAAIGYLESNYVGTRGRFLVRRRLATRILGAKLENQNATVAHHALLQLAKCRGGRTKLVTTNFDRIFEEVIIDKAHTVEKYKAPLLPVPKKHWDGLVYLHGLLDANPGPANLDKLVISSGDFGLAYLIDGWATSFVREMFRNFKVCFVGYSINDPVMRYMLDALAADRQQGQMQHEMFAFTSRIEEGVDRGKEWLNKNVTPIPYNPDDDHKYLYDTLKKWGEIHSQGVDGKESVIEEYAMENPLTSTPEDNFVGSVLWALSDQSGIPAKLFSKKNPGRCVDWIISLSEELCHIQKRKQLRSSSLFIENIQNEKSSKAMLHIARWMSKHLDDPRLFLFFAHNQRLLDKHIRREVELRLEEHFENEKRQARGEALLYILDWPTPPRLLRHLWKLLLAGRIRENDHNHEIYEWCKEFSQGGLNAANKIKLREILTPRVSLNPSADYSVPDDGKWSKSPEEIMNCEVVLAADNLYIKLNGSDTASEQWKKVLVSLLPEFRYLLSDVLDMQNELKEDSVGENPSYIIDPLESGRRWNKNYRGWEALLGLTLAAWKAAKEISPFRATREAEVWSTIPHTLFRRLSFFAASQDDIIPSNLAFDWLLEDDNKWLWDIEVHHEVMLMLKHIAPKLDGSMMAKLEEVVLEGAPPDQIRRHIPSDHLQGEINRLIFQRLDIIAQSGVALSERANNKYFELSESYRSFDFLPDDVDQDWSVSDVSHGAASCFDEPVSEHQLIEWLKANHEKESCESAKWLAHCKKNFADTAKALCALANEDEWPIDRWNEAFQAWPEEEIAGHSWGCIGPAIARLPDEKLEILADCVSKWMLDIATSFTGREHEFFSIAAKILHLRHEKNEEEVDDPELYAMVHPVGNITRALLIWWDRVKLREAEGLPEELKVIFTELCDASINKYRPGRTFLIRYIDKIFAADSDWAKRFLFPLLNWKTNPHEARSSWISLVQKQDVGWDVMNELKLLFFKTASHYDELGDDGKLYAKLLVKFPLGLGGIFSARKLRYIIRHVLSNDGRHAVADALVFMLETGGDQSADRWRNHISPLIDSAWPKTREYGSPYIAECFASLCVSSGEAFPDAFDLLRDWLEPLEVSSSQVYALREAGLCRQFPQPSLEFLDLVTPHEVHLLPLRLKESLADIKASSPPLETGPKFIRLNNLLRMHDPN